MKRFVEKACNTKTCSASAQCAEASCCCASSARFFMLMDAMLLASISICMIFNLRLSILVLVLVLVGLYIITLVWNKAPGWKSLLLEE